MSNETIVQNGAASATEDKKQNAAGTSVGKIGRLPKNIREEFNRRMEDGQAASEILPWVNGLPAVKVILDKYFRGAPISDGNLSLWRRTGFKHWQEKQESLAELKMLTEDAKDFSEATGGSLARGAASIAAAKILKLLHTIQPEQGSIEELTKISYAVTALLSAEQSQVRLEYEKTRVFQGNERLVLSWDKFLRSRVETAQRALEDAICKDIQAADIDNGEKIELLGHELFGKKWYGRKVGKKEEPKKEPEGGDGEPKKTDVQEHVPTTVQGHDMEVKKADGPTADQQVRPAMAQGHSTEAAVSPVREKAEVKEQEKPTEKKAEPTKMDATQRVPTAIQNDSTRVRVSGGEKAIELKASGGLPTTSEQHKESALAPLVRAATEKMGMNNAQH